MQSEFESVSSSSFEQGLPIASDAAREDAARAPRRDHFGFAITSFILSLVGFVLLILIFVLAVGSTDSSYSEQEVTDMIVGLFFILTFILMVLAIIFGALSLRTARGRGFAIAGFSISTVVLAAILLLLVIGVMVG